MRNFMLVILVALLPGCAGRAPAPVAVVQPQDRYMDCAAISVEVQANNKKISELGSEEGKKVAQNVIVGAAGVLIPVLWFGMDFQNAAGKEVAALQSRQQFLRRSQSSGVAQRRLCRSSPSRWQQRRRRSLPCRVPYPLGPSRRRHSEAKPRRIHGASRRPWS